MLHFDYQNKDNAKCYHHIVDYNVSVPIDELQTDMTPLKKMAVIVTFQLLVPVPGAL